MRKLILVSVSAAVGSITTALVMGPRASAVSGQGGGLEACSTKNGDVNADGDINLSDAVTILGHLFLGSPTELAPLCRPPAATSGLPDTGQSKCYDQAGKEISCNDASCLGQDGSYATGCPSEGRFTDNGDGTVTDNCTGLMWQKGTADVNGDGQTPDDGSDAVSWCNALAYCEGLSFAGHDDWQLPNVRELQSIVDYGRFAPAIDPVLGALSSVYWSSTSVAGAPAGAWNVNFNHGNVNGVLRDDDIYVRAVRTAR